MTCAMVKVLPEPVTPSRTWSRSFSLMPSTSSLIAVGWSPFGVMSETILKRLPPSDFSGRAGLCGTNIAAGASATPLFFVGMGGEYGASAM